MGRPRHPQGALFTAEALFWFRSSVLCLGVPSLIGYRLVAMERRKHTRKINWLALLNWWQPPWPTHACIYHSALRGQHSKHAHRYSTRCRCFASSLLACECNRVHAAAVDGKIMSSIFIPLLYVCRAAEPPLRLCLAPQLPFRLRSALRACSRPRHRLPPRLLPHPRLYLLLPSQQLRVRPLWMMLPRRTFPRRPWRLLRPQSQPLVQASGTRRARPLACLDSAALCLYISHPSRFCCQDTETTCAPPACLADG